MTTKTKVHLILLPFVAAFFALLIFYPQLFLIFVIAFLIFAIVALIYFAIHEAIVDRIDQKKRDAEWKVRQQELNEKWDIVMKRAPRTDE